MALQHIRSSTLDKRPQPASLSDGQLAINTNLNAPGVFFKDSNGALVKVGPTFVGTTAPNSTPGSGGATGNTLGEQWLDTSGGTYVLKIWDGTAWRSEAGEFVNVTGDTMTGALVMDNQQQVRFRETTANGTNYIALQAPASVASDKTITLPDVTGTVVTTGDTGSVTSTMIADGTIVNGDVNASAAIAGTKISPDFGSQNVTTTGTVTGASLNPTSSTVPTNGVYLPAANSVGISTNGTGRLFVDSSGKVGVGTSTPGYKLNVNGSGYVFCLDGGGTSRIAQLFQNTSGQLSLGLESSAGGALMTGATAYSSCIGSDTATSLHLGTNGTVRATIDSSGRLGIGTSTPTAQLTSSSTVQVTGFANPSGGAGLELGYDGTSSIVQSFNRGTSAYRDLLLSGNTIQMSIAGGEAARIDSSRRLLVGTSSTSDSAFLIVQGNTATSTGPAAINIATGTATPPDGNGLGFIRFSDSGNSEAASIAARRDGGTWSASSKPSRLVFSTCPDNSATPVERLRIDSLGAHTIRAQETTFTGNVLTLRSGRNTTNNTYYFFRCGDENDSAKLLIADSGNVTNTNNSYGAISDVKLKENIVDASSQWNDIKALQVRKYNFKEGQTHTQIGLVAQEVELVSPGLVSESPDRDEDGNDLGTVTKSVNYSVLYMKAVKALQEAMERIEQLEASNADLLARVTALETA